MPYSLVAESQAEVDATDDHIGLSDVVERTSLGARCPVIRTERDRGTADHRVDLKTRADYRGEVHPTRTDIGGEPSGQSDAEVKPRLRNNGEAVVDERADVARVCEDPADSRAHTAVHTTLEDVLVEERAAGVTGWVDETTATEDLHPLVHIANSDFPVPVGGEHPIATFASQPHHDAVEHIGRSELIANLDDGRPADNDPSEPRFDRRDSDSVPTGDEGGQGDHIVKLSPALNPEVLLDLDVVVTGQEIE